MDEWPAEAKLNKVPETLLDDLGGTLLDAELLDPIDEVLVIFLSSDCSATMLHTRSVIRGCLRRIVLVRVQLQRWDIAQVVLVRGQ